MATIDITALIDVVFLLVVFLLTTTTFVSDTGIEVTTPVAAQVDRLPAASLRVAIAASGAMYCEGDQVQPQQLIDRVSRFMDHDPTGIVIIVSDYRVSAGRLVAVMDWAKQAGASEISLVADPLERR